MRQIWRDITISAHVSAIAGTCRGGRVRHQFLTDFGSTWLAGIVQAV
jgi:hypothetical protein